DDHDPLGQSHFDRGRPRLPGARGLNAHPRIASMRLVMALLVRDEADIVRENLDFHFAQGVDFAVVMDNRSSDGTTEILEEYAARGLLRLIHQPGVYDQEPWVNEMVHIAVHEEGAD